MAEGDQGLEYSAAGLTSSLRFRTSAQEAVDEAATIGADVAAAVGGEVFQHDPRWDADPTAVDQRMPDAAVTNRVELGSAWHML